MITRIAQAAAILCLATFAAERAAAQAAPADVTFAVPVNMTGLPSEMTKIKLTCEVDSPAIMQGNGPTQPSRKRFGEVEVPVSQGEVVETVQVVVPLSTSELNDPSGKQATYVCRLAAFHQHPHNAWHEIHYTLPNDSVCTLTPRLSPIIGSFVW